MACNLKMASHKVKRREIWDLGIVVLFIRDTFDLLVFNVIWYTCLKMACKQKTVKQNRFKFGTRGVVVICIWCTFDRSVEGHLVHWSQSGL